MAKPTHPFHRVLNYLVLAVLAYAIYATYVNPPPSAPKEKPPEQSLLYETQQTQKDPKAGNDLAGMFALLSNPMQPRLHLVSETEGSGTLITCGQNVTYRYTDTIIGEPKPILSAKEARVRFGLDPMILGHGHALSGMRVGAKRTVQYPHVWGYVTTGPDAARGKDMQSEVTLISAEPEPPTSVMPMRIFVEPVHSQHKQFGCGSLVQFNMQIRTVDGTLLLPADEATMQTVRIRIGAGEAPYGLETALQTFSPGDRASILMPPEFLASFHPKSEESEAAKLFASLSYPPKQIILFELSDMSEIEPSIIEKMAAPQNPSTETTPQ